jgi:hypothetical protein
MQRGVIILRVFVEMKYPLLFSVGKINSTEEKRRILPVRGHNDSENQERLRVARRKQFS